MRPPKIPSVFRLGRYSQPKRFEYKPRLYDERKEDLEKRKRLIEAEMKRSADDKDAYLTDLRERISDNWHSRETRKVRQASNMRLIVILAIITMVVYYMYLKAV